MYLKASSNPIYNPIVQTMQSRLNVIRCMIHGDWPCLETDGLFGEQTKKVVMAYQTYRGITPVSGDVGETTFKYIYESFSQSSRMQPSLKPQAVNDYGMGFDLKSFSMDFSSKLAGVLNEVSNNLVRQVEWFKSRGISAKDIDMLMRNMFEKPNVRQLRTEIENSLFKELLKESKKNTNPNYGRVSNVDVLRTKEAQRQVSKKILNSSNRALVDKKIAQTLLDRIVQELESANFKNKISAALKNRGMPKISGGGVLTAIMLFPMFLHGCALIRALISGQSYEEPLKKFLTEFITFIEGVLIGMVVGAVVAFFGTVGWVAVVIVLVVSIIVGILLDVFFPNHKEWLAEKVINSAKRVATEFKTLLQSPVFYEVARSSYR